MVRDPKRHGSDLKEWQAWTKKESQTFKFDHEGNILNFEKKPLRDAKGSKVYLDYKERNLLIEAILLFE